MGLQLVPACAVAEAETNLELAEEIGEFHSRGYAHGVLSLISFHRNDLSRAREAVAAAARDLAGRNPGYPAMTFAAWPRALILEASGELRQALTSLADTWDMCDRLGLVLEYPAVGPTWSGSHWLSAIWSGPGLRPL